MGLAKHFYTMRQHGERIPNHVLRFFGELPPKSPRKNKVSAVKSKDKTIDDILNDLLGE